MNWWNWLFGRKKTRKAKQKKWWKVFLGISAATIVAAGVGVGIGYAIWHKQKNPTPPSSSAETSFNVLCTNPNLTFNTTNTLSLTWTSANYTPNNFYLKIDGSSNTNWTLTQDASQTLTLARQLSSLPAQVYNVVIVASDGTTTNEATVAVTVSNPVEKDLFFTTGDTTTTPNSTKAFYGTISAANFTLCDDADLEVKVNGAISSAWTVITFDNKTHIKITPPSSLTAGSKFQVAIYDAENDITSNAIGFSVQTKMNVDTDKYMTIDASGTVVIADVTATVSLNSQNPKLVGLYFGSNSTVTSLSCYSNQLQQLDVSNNSQLQTLNCYTNQLTQLDVSNNSQLQVLSCNTNQLTQLDVSNNSQLTILYCNSNQLTQLDVSNNSQLTGLYCATNQLTKLDVSHNSQLTTLYCFYNQLQQLDVSNHSLLTTLSCYSNPLNLIKLPTNKTSGSFTFTTSLTFSTWTAYQYAATGDIYCNASLTVNGLPSGWTTHNS